MFLIVSPLLYVHLGEV